MEAVHDALSKWRDVPFVTEDEFNEPDPLEAYANELLGDDYGVLE